MTSIDDTIFYRTDETTTGTTWSIFQSSTDNLLGKILTIVDATYPTYQGKIGEAVQRDAVKSLIKEAFSNYRQMDNWTYTSSTATE